MPDQRWIAEAERVLPCCKSDLCGDGYHIEDCPSRYRPAVAQWGQEMWEAGYDKGHQAGVNSMIVKGRNHDRL